MIYFIRKYWGGLYENEGRFLYVNRGTGFIGMPVRIDMPAEITLIRLKRK
jgi:predicted MPP superfamily phosphohydrolase